MITIRQSIQEIILDSPYLEEAMSQGIINLSALARLMRPRIKGKLYKEEVSNAAILMALKRLEPEVKKKSVRPGVFKEMDDITVRSDLVEITVLNSPELEKIRKELVKGVAEEKSFFFSFVQGVKESTILMNHHLEERVMKFLEKRSTVERIQGLSSITFSLPPSNHLTPGVYYTILKALAWENINLIEIMTNHNEITLVFDNADITRAFQLIKELKN